MQIRYITILVLLMVSGVIEGQEITGWELIDKILEQNKPVNKKNGCYILSGTGTYRNDFELVSSDEPDLFHFSYKMGYSHYDSNFYFENVLTDSKTRREVKTIYKYINSSEYLYANEAKGYYRIQPRATINSVIRNCYFNPIALLNTISNFKTEIGINVKNVDGNYVVEFETPNLETWNLIVSPNFECESFTRLKFDDFYGDTTEKVLWGNYEKVDGIKFPLVVTVFNRGYETHKVLQDFSLCDKRINEPRVLKINGGGYKTKNKEPAIDSKLIEIKVISEGLYEVIIEPINRRLVLAEFNNYLILLGGIDNSSNGDILIDFIKKKFPEKHIEFGSFSYGTKRSMGVVRSLVANKTKLLISKNNVDIVRSISQASFTKKTDNQELLMNTSIILPVGNYFSIEDSLNAMEIYNIETELRGDYFVYYFPIQKVLFAGNIDEAYQRKFADDMNEDSIFDKLKLHIETVLVENLEP